MKENILFCPVNPSGIDKAKKAIKILNKHNIKFEKCSLIPDCIHGKYINGKYINCEMPWLFAENGSKYADLEEIEYYARTGNPL